MRSELIEISLIDQYLFRQLNDDERKTFETSLLVDEALADKVDAQRTAHRLVRQYARNKERGRLEDIYQRLLREPAFIHRLKTIFT
jgi:hypothetical protein